MQGGVISAIPDTAATRESPRCGFPSSASLPATRSDSRYQLSDATGAKYNLPRTREYGARQEMPPQKPSVHRLVYSAWPLQESWNDSSVQCWLYKPRCFGGRVA